MAGNKYTNMVSGLLTERFSKQTSAGAGDAGEIPALDASGRLDASMMPTGVAADTQIVTASEALAAGDVVNIWNSSGAKVRKADASVSGKEAHGFVIASVLISGSATVYFIGTNAQVTGLTPGVQYLSATTPGLVSASPPTGTGQIVQRIGFATSATTVNFTSEVPVCLA